MVAEKAGAIGWMIFDHPERRNAVTQGMWLQIGEILEDFAKDEAIRVVVLKGEGEKAFVSGADISQFGQQRRNAAEVAASNRLTDVARQALEAFPKPTIAMIQGFCLGGGSVVQQAVEACVNSADYQEGRTAFMEKRPPLFTGR
jgi:enoyl-CoA hydratase/carnithine racemase